MSGEWNGVDRRVSQAEEYGELKATVANNAETISKLSDSLERYINASEEKDEMLKEEIHKIHEEIVAYKTFVRVVKGLGAIVILVATLKFGDVVDVWRSM